MKLINTRNPSQEVTFERAVLLGSASGGGLFMPKVLEPFKNMEELLEKPFVERSVEIVSAIIGEEFRPAEIRAAVEKALSFPVPVTRLSDRIFSLELFHGPTLAFKDFGAQLMAQILQLILARQAPGKIITILTATSGDTGAAVAHAFRSMPGVQVRVLYPAGLIAPLQEKLFCTMGGNVRTFRVAGTFDDCQALVKEAFTDYKVVQKLGLTSANSINICRLLAQILYYFEGVAALRQMTGKKDLRPFISVPSGNFGNLTAGLMAQRLGLPVARFIVATNANEIVPRFLAGEEYKPRPAIATLANAMDVGAPNNWERMMYLFQRDQARLRRELSAGSLTDEEIRKVLKELWTQKHLSEPHSAIAYEILRRNLPPEEHGLFLSTAHPAKFREIVEETLGINVPLPPALASVADLPVLSEELESDIAILKKRLTE